MASVWLGGAETGSISETATPGGGCSVQSTNVRTGAYAYRCTSTNAFFDFIIYSKATMFYRFYAYILANPAATNTFFQLINGSTGLLTLRLTSTGKVQLILGASAGTVLATSTNSIPLNAWFRIEVKIICGTSSNATLEAKIYDASDSLLETLTATGKTTAAATVTGAGYGFRTAAQQIDFDDIAEDDSAYCGVGRVIARQPKIGTPTYNAWTKVGTDPYWADTPFNTANRATSVNSGIPSRQTKLVSAFNATQTGHGNQTIGANDIINAAGIYYVAKRGTGTTATYAMNFIYNSVLTENAVLLTTSDDYYYSHITSSLTLALLNSMQAGGKQITAGSVLMTIEDLWVIVDYRTAVTTAVIIQKSLKYAVKTIPAAKNKSLKYSVKATPDAITKSLKYTLIKSFSDTKSLQYTILTAGLITKSLIYEIENPIPPWVRPHGMYDFLALKVRGKLGKIATFEEQWWGRQVSPPFSPYNPRTSYQQSWRSIFTQGVDNWHGFSQSIKDQYREKAKDLTMTGFNYYLSQYLNANYPPW